MIGARGAKRTRIGWRRHAEPRWSAPGLGCPDGASERLSGDTEWQAAGFRDQSQNASMYAVGK